jgi:hypothetical protein
VFRVKRIYLIFERVLEPFVRVSVWIDLVEKLF